MAPQAQPPLPGPTPPGPQDWDLRFSFLVGQESSEVSEQSSAPGPVGVASRPRVVSALQAFQQHRLRAGRARRAESGGWGHGPRALTICPTQTLAASIMAPSAMERADSFSMCGFPDSSSSTTCRAGQTHRELGPQARPLSTVCGGRRGPPGGRGSILYISILFQGDAAVAVRVVHVEQNWGRRGEENESGEDEKGALGSPLPQPPPPSN